MTPTFLLLSTRSEDELVAHEHHSLASNLGIPEDQVDILRLEQGPVDRAIAWDDYAGVVLGGSPFTSLTPVSMKTSQQRRVETELHSLLADMHRADVPFLGLCYGTGTFGRIMGGTVDATFAEPTSAPLLRVTAAGRADPLLAGVPQTFRAYAGHKEALSALPPAARLLVTGTECPFQMWRLGTRQYVCQFHPELDADGLELRMATYLHSGYFAPEEFNDIVRRMRQVDVSHAHRIISNFARLALAA